MELSDYIRVLRKNWLIIVVATLVGLGAAAGYSLTRTPLYESQASVVVSTQSSGSVQEITQGSTFTQQRVATYVNVATTPLVLDPVIRDLGLDVTAGALAKSVSVTSTLNTTFITIAVTDADPVKAADIANAVAAQLPLAVEEIEPSTGFG